MKGKEIKMLRILLGLKQEEIAGRLRVSRQSMSNYERNVKSIPGPVAALAEIIAKDNDIEDVKWRTTTS